MELKQLSESLMQLFGIDDIALLGNALMRAVCTDDTRKYAEFFGIVKDLDVDWLQMVFQYHYADRKEKMQDYTPSTLAFFMGLLAGEADTVIDMCAGSGALTIQKWKANKSAKFRLYEYDERVIPFLLFNMAVRNIECEVFRADVLQNEVFAQYRVSKGEKFGRFQEVKRECFIDF